MREVDGTKGYTLKNTREVQEKVIEKYLNFKLTEEDFADKGKEAGKISGELNKLEAEFDRIKKEWKEKIEEQEAALSLIHSTIRRGDEDRKVICVEQKDFAKYVVNYVFNGEIMHSRPMEMSERQMELVTDIKTVEKANEKATMQEHLRVASDPKAQEVKDVMREETNKKTKQDMSNRGH
jgi:hypothetical protein